MPLLDFITKRNSQQQSAAESTKQQKPENAQRMYARRDVEEKANFKPLDQLPQQPKAELSDIKARLEKATQHLHANAPSATPAPAGGTASPEPQRQAMMSQDKEAPALSPTSMQAGKSAAEKQTPVKADEPSSKEQPKETPAPTKPPTPPRGHGGWER